MAIMAAAFCVSRAGAQGVGTTTADILKINEGVRPAGMGGAYTAMGDDLYSVNYNPAGLSYIRATDAIYFHLDGLAGIQYENFSFGTAWGMSQVLAANVVYRYSPPIDNQNGNPAVTADDLLISLSYAQKVADNFRLGLTLKYLKSDLASFTASAFAFDGGAVMDHLPYGLKLGLSFQNLGTSMSFAPVGAGVSSNSPSDPLPLFLRFGVGTHQVFEGNRDLIVGLEVFKPSDQDIKIGLGAEFWLFPELFAIRAGYKIENLGTPYGGTDYLGNSVPGVANAFNNYTFGCILTRRIDGDDFSVDIAYNPGNFVDTTEDTFFFGLNFKFNQLQIF